MIISERSLRQKILMCIYIYISFKVESIMLAKFAFAKKLGGLLVLSADRAQHRRSIFLVLRYVP